MQKNKRNEEGFACIFVLMLAVALFIVAAVATEVMYAAHRQNLTDKGKIIKRAEALTIGKGGQESGSGQKL